MKKSKKSWMLVLALSGLLLSALPTLAHDENGDSGKPAPSHTIFTGKVSAVDSQAATITLTNKTNESRNFTIPAATKITINGKEATLSEVKVDMYGGVKLDANGTPIELRAYVQPLKTEPGDSSGKPATPTKGFTGKITAVDAAAATISITNRIGETRGFTLPAGIKIQINGQPGVLTDVTTAMYGGVIFGTDGTTPVELRAYLPKPQA
jgi:hypothetical protein